MKPIFSSKYLQLTTLIFSLLAILVVRLFMLTVMEKEKWSEAATDLSVKTIYTSAPRGQILDRNGKVLAGNSYTFSVQMSRKNMTDELTNQTIRNLVATLENNGDEIYDNLPVKMSGADFYYEDATNKKQFLSGFGIKEELSAKEAFDRLRAYFRIDSALSDFEARKIMVVRNELAAMGYKKYIPVTVARNISNPSIATLEENSGSFPGVEVFTEVSRWYPNGNTAAHVLGYMGKISDSEKEYYIKEKGYHATDLIGKDGIEKKYESTLKGKDGEKKVQVDASGDLIKTLTETGATKGKDITLTIDLNLQKTAEKALDQGLSAMRGGGTFTGKYGNWHMKSAPQAETGAVVAIDVKTGEVMAMANCPDFDPNLFAHGISTVDWESLQSQNPRDPLAPAPLYNIAARSAVQPGSTFKLVTATAALQCGLDPYRRLYDDGYISFGNNTFGCIAWNEYGEKHGYLNLQEAIGVSCNYYFFDIATGQDFYTGGSLGYKKKISLDVITDYAKQYGLGKATGIEIPETVAKAPSVESKTAQLKGALKNVLLAEAETYFDKETLNHNQKLEERVEEIVSWTGKGFTREEVGEKLKEGLGVKKGKVEKLADLCQYTYFNQATWNIGDTLNISIGQGANSYTPLQMANYIATIGNKGIKNQVSVVEKIGDRGTIEKAPSTKVKVDNDAYFEEITDGMVQVANGSGGSLAGVFNGFPVTVAGKTGTAERAGKINPVSEVEYIQQHLGGIAPYLSWTEIQREIKRLMKKYPDIYTSEHTAVRRAVINLSHGKVTAESIDRYKSSYDNFAWAVAMAPAEKPRIAVAVMIPQGRTSANAGPIVREVLGTFFDQKKKE